MLFFVIVGKNVFPRIFEFSPRFVSFVGRRIFPEFMFVEFVL